MKMVTVQLTKSVTGEETVLLQCRFGNGVLVSKVYAVKV